MDNLIFSGRSNPKLTEEICNILKKKSGRDYKGKVDTKNFPSGEIYCHLKDNVRGKNVFFVQSTNNPNHDFMELLLLIHTAKLASAEKITAVIPYFAYARQDRKTEPRTPISSRLMFDLLKEAGATRIITIDIHNLVLQGQSSVPFDSLIPCNLLIKYFKEKLAKTKEELKDWKLVAPDLGSVKKIEKFSEVLGLDFAIVHKKRLSATRVIQKRVIGNVKGKKILMIDDMSESLGTLDGAAKLLKQKGAKEVFAFATHLPLTSSGKKVLKGDIFIDKIITTNTVGGLVNTKMIEVLSIAPVLAEAIDCTIKNESISGLFPITGF